MHSIVSSAARLDIAGVFSGARNAHTSPTRSVEGHLIEWHAKEEA